MRLDRPTLWTESRESVTLGGCYSVIGLWAGYNAFVPFCFLTLLLCNLLSEDGNVVCVERECYDMFSSIEFSLG